MATLTDIRNIPLSGAIHIDALINQSGLNWSSATDIPFNTIRYSFSLGGYTLPQSGNITPGTATEFSFVQQAATRDALSYLSEVTGIQFAETSAAEADVHFANAAINQDRVVGSFNWRTSYTEDDAGTVHSYDIDGTIYLDNDEYASYNATLNEGSQGYETLLHELGHMLGLKHPFEGTSQLPDYLDTTYNTLMSYDSSGEAYSEFRGFDLAALGWLYGGDGLGGTFGVDAQGRLLAGSAEGEQLNGSSGMDLLVGLEGNDILDGGAGLDQALYVENRADYQITRTDQGFTVVGPDGSDLLRNTERIVFGDKNVALDIDGAGGAAYRLYEAALNRAPDSGGLGFWINVLDQGYSLRDVAAAFLVSEEFIANFGANTDNATFVTRLYQNILDRAPEQGGYDFWVNVLNDGNSRAGVLEAFSESGENRSALIGTIGNGIDYTPYA